MTATRVLLILTGLFGAAGVALAAAASHSAFPNAGAAAEMLLAHAPALLAVALGARSHGLRPGPLLAGAALIGAGVALFAGTLVFRAATGWPGIPMAAPAGGMLTIAGWLAVVLAGVQRRA